MTAHSEEPKAKPMEGPSEFELETQEKNGHTHKMLTSIYVVTSVGDNGEPLLSEAVNAKAKHAYGCLVRGNIRIIHDDWRKVPKVNKEFVWSNWV